jgi:hypothetical protein
MDHQALPQQAEAASQLPRRPAGPVFISYSHRQKAWVGERLKPCLAAGGVAVLLDELFDAGKAVIGQMDSVQDQATIQILVLTEDYLKSAYCRHEMDRAIARDPAFERGVVLPVLRDDCVLPPQLQAAEPLYVDLRDDARCEQWALLEKGCGSDLGCHAPAWFATRDDIVQWLNRKESVNLVSGKGVKWKPLIDHLRQTALPDLKIIDLEDPATASRPGLLTQILREFGVRATLPDKPNDLPAFAGLLQPLPFARLAITHFDLVAHRHDKYDVDLFAALRHLVMTQKKLGLVLQSRQPLVALLPANHPLSSIDVKTVELAGRP